MSGCLESRKRANMNKAELPSMAGKHEQIYYWPSLSESPAQFAWRQLDVCSILQLYPSLLKYCRYHATPPSDAPFNKGNRTGLFRGNTGGNLSRN
jgi:hypothetical protein